MLMLMLFGSLCPLIFIPRTLLNFSVVSREFSDGAWHDRKVHHLSVTYNSLLLLA